MDYTLLDNYDVLFDDYYNYIGSHASFKVEVIKKSMPKEIEFPTILMREALNINQSNGTTTNRVETVDLLTYQVDIVTKDLIDENGLHPSLEIQKELKYLTFKFFFERGYERTSTEYWENTNIVYDRLTCLFQGNLQSWNKHIR